MEKSAAIPPIQADVVLSASPSLQTIDEYLNNAIAKLIAATPADQQAGRDALMNAAGASGWEVASPAFKSRFCDEANKLLLPVAANPNFRVRLNAAIAVSRIAEKTDSAKFIELTTAFLNDQSEAVAMWGMKSARAQLAHSGATSLLNLIVEAAKRFPGITFDAYATLTTISPPTQATLAAVQSLFEARIAMYSKVIPPDPIAESLAMSRLVESSWWAAQSESAKIRTAQLISNLGSVVGQRVNGPTTKNQLEASALIVKQVGSSGGAIGITDPDKVSLRTDLAPLGQLSRSAPAAQISSSAELVAPAFKKAFPSLAPPPRVAATAPTTSAAQ